MPNNTIGGSIRFPPNMYNPYTPKANPINTSNPFTMPNQTIGFQPLIPYQPPSLVKPNQPVSNPTIPTQNPPTQQQAQQTPIEMPNSLLKNPVAQGFSNPIQQPTRPKIYMPDFLGARRPSRNWSDAYSIANLR